MRCLRHKIHMGLFCTFGLSALNWILTLSWKNLVSPQLAEPLLCTTFTLTYFFHLTSFYWMFLEGFYLFLQVNPLLSGTPRLGDILTLILSATISGQVQTLKASKFLYQKKMGAFKLREGGGSQNFRGNP